MSEQSSIVLDLASKVEFAQDGIVSKTILEQPYGEVSLFMMSKGQSLSEHTSSHPAIVHVLQGEGIVQLAGVDHTVQPGSWVFMPPHLPHAVEATQDLVFLLTLFEPPE